MIIDAARVLRSSGVTGKVSCLGVAAIASGIASLSSCRTEQPAAMAQAARTAIVRRCMQVIISVIVVVGQAQSSSRYDHQGEIRAFVQSHRKSPLRPTPVRRTLEESRLRRASQC